MMADMIRWGVLSTANIGRNRVIPAIQQSSNGRVTAVASRKLENVGALANLSSPQLFGQLIEREVVRWRNVAQEAKLQPN